MWHKRYLFIKSIRSILTVSISRLRPVDIIRKTRYQVIQTIGFGIAGMLTLHGHIITYQRISHSFAIVRLLAYQAIQKEAPASVSKCFFGRSVIIGLKETQQYQRFAGC